MLERSNKRRRSHRGNSLDQPSPRGHAERGHGRFVHRQIPLCDSSHGPVVSTTHNNSKQFARGFRSRNGRGQLRADAPLGKIRRKCARIRGDQSYLQLNNNQGHLPLSCKGGPVHVRMFKRARKTTTNSPPVWLVIIFPCSTKAEENVSGSSSIKIDHWTNQQVWIGMRLELVGGFHAGL